MLHMLRIVPAELRAPARLRQVSLPLLPDLDTRAGRPRDHRRRRAGQRPACATADSGSRPARRDKGNAQILLLKDAKSEYSPQRALEIARRIQFHQVTLAGNRSAAGISEIDPIQREIFDALKLDTPSKDRLESAV